MEIPVLHLVNRFWIGGAERQFVERLRRHPAGFEAVLGCLELSGPLLDQVRALGYEPFLFPLARSFLRANTIKQVARIAALIRELGVRIVYGTEDIPVAMIGNLWPVKGHRTLVEAAALLSRRLPRVKFLCAGEGPERDYLEKRIAELGLQDRVFLLGHRLDVPAVLSRARAAC